MVDWSWSRQFFYGRLRRRLAENQALQRMAAVDPSGERARHKQLLHSVIKGQVKDQKRRLPSYDNIENHVMEAKVSRSEEDKTVSFRPYTFKNIQCCRFFCRKVALAPDYVAS